MVCSWTHICLARDGGADVSTDVQVPDEAITFQSVNPGSERQCWPFLRRGELHLGQIVDEEVEFGGDASQTGLDQPEQVREGGRRVRDQSAAVSFSYLFPSVFWLCIFVVLSVSLF